MQRSLSACPEHENVLYKGRIISRKSSDLWEWYRHPKIVMGKKLSGYSEAKVRAIITPSTALSENTEKKPLAV